MLQRLSCEHLQFLKRALTESWPTVQQGNGNVYRSNSREHMAWRLMHADQAASYQAMIAWI